MRSKRQLNRNPLLAVLLFFALALAGCSGDDGVNGANGVDGEDAILPVADLVSLNPKLDLSNTVSLDPTTGALTVHFFLTDGEGNGVNAFDEAYEFRLYVSELIPANPTTAVGAAWDQLISERGTPAAGSPMPGTLTLVDADTGEYTYAADTMLAASSNVTRVTMRARWRETIDGVRYNFALPVNASYDFLQFDPATELASSGADMVTTAACESCHSTRIGNVGHGGGYTEVKTCNSCHNLNYQENPEADLAFMIHRIHDAGMFDALDHGEPADFSHVTYPQHINTCSTCHAADAPEASLAMTGINRANCGSCHEAIDFASVDPNTNGHGTDINNGGQQLDDLACTTCHHEGSIIGGTNLSPSVVHNPAPLLANTPEFDVTISMTPPAVGTFYTTGETPVVTVTLANGGTPVAGTVYTADKDAKGVSGGALSSANLYVYGPRSDAVPVLTVCSSTDPDFGTLACPSGNPPAPATAPRQGHDLTLTGGVNADLQVTTTAAGYSYQLMDNIADLVPGTYMVRFEGGDYGAISDTDYVTSSTKVINFQVKTADVEHKMSGDACTNCHGTTVMHLEGAHPHNQAFDTDGCLGCHDISGNYGDYIGNRVHAVHKASATGDLKATTPGTRDWSHITFPQEVNNCTICHTDTNTDAPVWRRPDALACGGCHGTKRDAIPADYPNVDADRIIREAAAAAHMLDMGGDFDPTTNPQTQCIVCHGEDRIADLYDTHHLITFPVVEEVDPNE